MNYMQSYDNDYEQKLGGVLSALQDEREEAHLKLDKLKQALILNWA